MVLKSSSIDIYPNKVPHKPYPLIGSIILSIVWSSFLSKKNLPTFSLLLIIAISSEVLSFVEYSSFLLNYSLQILLQEQGIIYLFYSYIFYLMKHNVRINTIIFIFIMFILTNLVEFYRIKVIRVKAYNKEAKCGIV